MKYQTILFAITFLFLVSCKNQSTQEKSTSAPEKPKINLTSEMVNILNTHGTLEKWNEMKYLSYEIVRPNGNEKQQIDLKTRNERIEGSNFKTGYDGNVYWVDADSSFKQDPVFYHNLMFYFYAMPFVLADEGIVFTKIDPLNFEDKSYPGFRISYQAGVGESPEDEYFIHYNPETYQMEWLGYTVTYFTGKKSEKIKWIRYDDWKNFAGLILPNSMTWYTVENGEIKAPRGKATQFVNVTLSKDAPDQTIFAQTPGAKIVK